MGDRRESPETWRIGWERGEPVVGSVEGGVLEEKGSWLCEPGDLNLDSGVDKRDDV